MSIRIRLSSRICRAVVAMVLLMLCVPPSNGTAKQPSIDDVRDAWKARQERIKSASFSWKTVEFIAAQSVPPAWPTRENHEFLPDEDITIERVVNLQLSDGMMRYSYDGQVYNQYKGGVRQTEYVSVSDGVTSKNFFDILDGDQGDYPRSGFIRKEPLHFDYDNRGLLPILITCRPLNVTMGGVDLAAYELSGEVEEIDNHTCYLLQPRVPSATQPEKSFWVDPKRDCNVLRITAGRPGKLPIYALDISYAQSKGNPSDWVPSSWEFKVMGGKERRLFNQESVVVTNHSLNEEIAASEFQFEFPPGTAVVDSRTNQRFMMLKDGEKREVTKEELSRDAKYRGQISTEADDAALLISGKGGNAIKFAFVSGGLLLVGASLVLRHWYARLIPRVR